MTFRLEWVVPVAIVLWGCGEEGGRSVPAELSAIESTAEDSFDSALGGDVASVRTQAKHLAASWKKFRPQAEHDGVTQDDLTAMDAAVDELVTTAAGNPDPIQLARVTNRVSGRMASLYDVYDPAIPADVLELDYLGREVQVDAMDAAFDQAAKDVGRLATTWKALRGKVVEAGGKREATDFDQSISAERSALSDMDDSALEGAAKTQLDRVDDLERVFSNASDPPD
jgi:hypothetical protein